MPTIIVAESPDTADARALIAELDAYLIPLYPVKYHYGYSIEKLLEEGVFAQCPKRGYSGDQIMSISSGTTKTDQRAYSNRNIRFRFKV
jgi:hypothetical protein